MADGFSGDRHAPMRSPLAKLEQWVIARNVSRFPHWIQGYHLTLVTIPGVGHWVQEEAAEQVSGMMKAWLRLQRAK